MLWAQGALIGEVYPEIRAIALRFDSDRRLLVRYYLDREPIEDDYEAISLVCTNIDAYTSHKGEFSAFDDEVVYSTALFRDLDPLDGFVYARRELGPVGEKS